MSGSGIDWPVNKPVAIMLVASRREVLPISVESLQRLRSRRWHETEVVLPTGSRKRQLIPHSPLLRRMHCKDLARVDFASRGSGQNKWTKSSHWINFKGPLHATGSTKNGGILALLTHLRGLRISGPQLTKAVVHRKPPSDRVVPGEWQAALMRQRPTDRSFQRFSRCLVSCTKPSEIWWVPRFRTPGRAKRMTSMALWNSVESLLPVTTFLEA